MSNVVNFSGFAVEDIKGTCKRKCLKVYYVSAAQFLGSLNLLLDTIWLLSANTGETPKFAALNNEKVVLSGRLLLIFPRFLFFFISGHLAC